MKVFASVLFCGALLSLHAGAAPTLRLGDFEVKKGPTSFTLSDRQTAYPPLEIRDDEAFLLLHMAEALRPLTANELRRSLARDRVHVGDVAGMVGSLNARAEKRLHRRLVVTAGETFAIDPRPRRVRGVDFRPVEEGVIWRGKWIDLTDNQARFLALVAAAGTASYEDLEKRGWPSRRARELVARVNARAGEALLGVRRAEGVHLACAGSLGAVAEQLPLLDEPANLGRDQRLPLGVPGGE